MGGRRALLGPAYVQDGVGEIDLIPTQVYKLGRQQTVAEGDKDLLGRPSTSTPTHQHRILTMVRAFECRQ